MNVFADRPSAHLSEIMVSSLIKTWARAHLPQLSVPAWAIIEDGRHDPILVLGSPCDTVADKVTEVPRRRNKGISCIWVDCIGDELRALERVRVEGYLLHDGLSVNG